MARLPAGPRKTRKTQREALAFERLRALAVRGYAADMERDVPGGGILFHHFAGPDLILFPDGAIEALDKNFPLHRDPTQEADLILAHDESDERKFARFLERLPPPGSRRSRWRERLRVMGCVVVVAVVSITLTVLIVNG